MKIFLIDCASNFLDFALRCQNAGHDIVWWDQNRQKDNSVRLAGRGMVQKLTDF